MDVGTMIVGKLNGLYGERGLKDQAARKFKFGASNLHDCLRKSAFLLNGMEQLPLTPEAVRIFEFGHQRGDALEAAAKEIWPDAVSQVPLHPKVGKFELGQTTVDLWIPSLKTVVDFKTSGAYGFGLLDTEGVSMDYQLQVHAYRDWLAMRDGVAPSSLNCLLIYEAKDSDARKGVRAGSLRGISVPWTEELEFEYTERLAAIQVMLEHREQGTLKPHSYPELPLVEYGIKKKVMKHSWKCKFCSIGEVRGGCYAK
jgi:hypothetical protein